MKQSADDNFEFDENTRKFCKPVENTVGKGEIARYKHFLLFLQCFQKACFPEASKGVIVWEWVNSLPSKKMLYTYFTTLKAFSGKAFSDKHFFSFLKVDNVVQEGENAV